MSKAKEMFYASFRLDITSSSLLYDILLISKRIASFQSFHMKMEGIIFYSEENGIVWRSYLIKLKHLVLQ